MPILQLQQSRNTIHELGLTQHIPLRPILRQTRSIHLSHTSPQHSHHGHHHQRHHHRAYQHQRHNPPIPRLLPHFSHLPTPSSKSTVPKTPLPHPRRRNHNPLPHHPPTLRPRLARPRRQPLPPLHPGGTPSRRPQHLERVRPARALLGRPNPPATGQPHGRGRPAVVESPLHAAPGRHRA